MKITDENLIKKSEKELIDRICSVVDWESIQSIFMDEYRIKIQDDRECRQGDIVVHDSNIAYNLEFDVRATISVLFDRSGNYLSITTGTESGAERKREPIVESEGNLEKEIAPPLFTYVEDTETTKAEDIEDIIELTDIVRDDIIELTNIVDEERVAA